MRNGVPFHVAFGLSSRHAEALALDRTERAAMSVIFSEFEGNKFNWELMEFEETK